MSKTKLLPEQVKKTVATTKEVLLENNIPFEVKNNGFHFIVRTHTHRYDYWPTSGKYMIDSNYQIRLGGLTPIIEHINDNKSDKTDVLDIFDKDIDDMNTDELKKTIYALCEKLNEVCK